MEYQHCYSWWIRMFVGAIPMSVGFLVTNQSTHKNPSIITGGGSLPNKWWFLMVKAFGTTGKPSGIIMPYGSKYLLRKCLWYNLLWFGGLSTFSDSVWIHRDGIFLVFFPEVFNKPERSQDLTRIYSSDAQLLILGRTERRNREVMVMECSQWWSVENPSSFTQ